MDPLTASLVQKVVEERKQEELKYHKERVNKLMQEKIELEIRLLVINDVLKQIEEYTKNNPIYKE